MTEPTPEEVERVAVAIVMAEMTANGMPIAASVVSQLGTDVAVEVYGPAATAAIKAIRTFDAERTAA